jgi:site-specific recombinase XerD
MPAAMSRTAPRELFALVESFFLEYLPRQRGASPHTVRAYRDSVKLLFEFTAQRHARDISSLALGDLDADAIAAFLDHIEANRSNSAATATVGVLLSAASSSISCAMTWLARCSTRGCSPSRRRRPGRVRNLS